jgi:uncharacterized membrane protein
MTPERTPLMYIASALALIVAIGLAVQGDAAQAIVLALGAAFLIYWALRQNRERGDR